MVSSSSVNREQLKQKLIKTSQEHLARRSEMPVHREDKAKDLLINLEFKNGHPLIIITMRADGVTPEMFDWYHRDVFTHCTKIDKNVLMKVLETEADGTVISH